MSVIGSLEGEFGKKKVYCSILKYCLGNVVPESSSHLFLECNRVVKLWYPVINWFGVKFVIHNDPKCQYLQFQGIIRLSEKKKKRF